MLFVEYFHANKAVTRGRKKPLTGWIKRCIQLWLGFNNGSQIHEIVTASKLHQTNSDETKPKCLKLQTKTEN